MPLFLFLTNLSLTEDIVSIAGASIGSGMIGAPIVKSDMWLRYAIYDAVLKYEP